MDGSRGSWVDGRSQIFFEWLERKDGQISSRVLWVDGGAFGSEPHGWFNFYVTARFFCCRMDLLFRVAPLESRANNGVIVIWMSTTSCPYMLFFARAMLRPEVSLMPNNDTPSPVSFRCPKADA